MKFVNTVLLTAALATATVWHGRAATIIWTNTATGNWINAANWSPQQVPGAGDHAIITNGTVTIPASATFAILDVGGGTITGSLVASNGAVNWTGGAIGMNGSLTVLSNAFLNVSGSAQKSLQGVLTNAGTVIWTGTGSLAIYNNGSSTFTGAIYNQPGALFDIQGDVAMSLTFGPEFVDNAGTLRKSAGSGTTSIGIQFNNTGLVSVLTGTVVLGNGGSVGGQYTTAAGTTVNLGNGSFTSGASPVFSGAGQSTFTGATLTLSNNVIPGLVLSSGNLVLGPGFQGGSITNFTLSGVTLVGNYQVSGVMTWTSGIIGSGNGSLTVLSNALLNVSGSASKTLYCALTNAGTVIWTGTGSLIVYNNGGSSFSGAIFNRPGALFDIQNDAAMSLTFGPEFVNNAGTLRKSAGSGTTSIGIQFNNTGLVNVLTGTVVFGNGGSVGGQYTTAAGTTVNLGNGSFTSGASPVFSGAGQSTFTGSTLTLSSNVIPGLILSSGNLVLGPGFQGGSITNLTLSGSVLVGNYQVSSAMTLAGGVIGAGNGSLTVLSNAILNISGSAPKSLYGTLTNAGTVVWTGTGAFTLYNNGGSSFTGAIFNRPGALFDIQNDTALARIFGPEFFNNAGTVRKSAGSGTTSISGQFNNSGLVEADKATITFQGGFAPMNGELRSGLASTANFGKFNFPGTVTLGGTVGVALLNGYVPAAGNSFTILTFGAHTGIFTNLDLPPAGLWTTNYTATSFTLTVASINKLAYTIQPAGGVLTNVIIPPFVVQIEDSSGNPLPSNGVPVTISLGSSASGLHGTLTQSTDASGKVTFNDIRFDQVGTKTLLASAINLTPATSLPFKILPVFGMEWIAGKANIELNATNNFGPVVISASTNLLTWTPLYTNQLATNSIQFIDPGSTNFAHRFYRTSP